MATPWNFHFKEPFHSTEGSKDHMIHLLTLTLSSSRGLLALPSLLSNTM